MDDQSIFARLAMALDDDWTTKARPEQLAPPGDWTIWLILAGRGFGKTRAGAEWVRGLAEAGTVHRIALVGPTAADVRDTMVEGESGILNICPDWNRPVYEPSKRRLTWPNNCIATMFSSEEPERLRGPQFGAAWCDEIAAWNNIQSTWDMLQFGLRLGQRPRAAITTTPRPSRLLKDLIRREGEDVAITRGSTYDNRANLAPSFFSQIVSRFEGTRLGRQELNAELLSDTPGALWQMDWLDRDRVSQAPEELKRIVVAIDPAVSTNENSDETGIVVAGMDGRGHCYVLEDLSGKYAPHEWARRAVEAFDRHKADRIIGEVNQGGAMVESTLRTVSRNVPYKAVHASRGKVTRAEPVSAFYEKGMVHHVGGAMTVLEDQMTSFTSDFDRSRMGYSPDRVDALVWALTEFLPGLQHTSSVVPFWQIFKG
ncbi:terminase family protein [uncultured Rhodoblastus sp.]|uniref:DNA-packaging protein n=1 Tax=uncultured Rhodoblastus sp. TaxID=543037 RepID=UPI0025EA6352|nr:terminase family protein [uncultured Rhodoblastus sp.]